MNDEQLDAVTGGTVKELKELAQAMTNNSFLKVSAGFLSHFSEMILIMKKIAIHDLANIGIEANIDIGVFGTSIGEKNNTYKNKATKKSLTHAQVLEKIKAYAA